MFVPLHAKSEHSMGYGVAPVEALVRRAADAGCSAIGLTDLENLYGQVRFHHAARAAGMKAITGVELRRGFGPRSAGETEGRLVLLARDHAGYESLCRVVTHRRAGRTAEVGDPRSCVALGLRGVFYLSDDPEVVEALLRAGISLDDVRFLLVRPGVPARRPPRRVRCVADPDVVFLEPGDRELQRLLFAIRRRVKVGDVRDADPVARTFVTGEALAAMFRDAPEALEATREIADACALDLTRAPRIMPGVELPAGETADAALRARCARALVDGRRAGRWCGDAYDARLARELDVIATLDLASYFLAVAEITDRARALDISIAGRGSASGALTAHVLGITPIDPVAHGLVFERFVHAGREKFPDIDLDVASNRRDELLDWTLARFGARAAMVSAHSTFRLRGAFREGLLAFGMRAPLVDRFCATLPPEDLEQEGAPSAVRTELLPPELRDAAPLIERLVGRPQHVSVHPGGVVVADAPLERYVPLERAPKGVQVTQYDMRSVAKIGLLKIDLLGNRALASLDEAVARLGRAEDADADDERTMAALREARTVGCFQIESPAVRSTLRRLPMRRRSDLVAALAIVRPGPASGEAKAAFIRRAWDEEPAIAPHPRLEPLLRETYGLILYEEDLIRVIAAMTNLTLEAADDMRVRIVESAEIPSAQDVLRRSFLERVEATGVTHAEADAVWSVLLRFAAYSFNKAHATAYADVAWRSAQMKTHHPVELACGVLNHYGGSYPLRTVAADFARAGVRILGPDVNASAEVHDVQEGVVRIGLGAVKHLARGARQQIYDLRPFRDLRDLVARARLSRRELVALVRCGACDSLAPLSWDAYPIAHEDFLARAGSDPTPASLDGFVVRSPHGSRAPAYRALVRIKNELFYFQMHLADHPLRVLRPEATRSGAVATSELSAYVGRRCRIAGIVAATRRVRTRAGRVMQFVTFEDEDGLVEAVLFPGVYAALADPVTNPGPFLVDGEVAEDHGDAHLVVSHLSPFHERPRPYAQAASQRP